MKTLSDHEHCDCPDGRVALAAEVIDQLTTQLAAVMSMTVNVPPEARHALQYGAAVLTVLEREGDDGE